MDKRFSSVYNNAIITFLVLVFTACTNSPKSKVANPVKNLSNDKKLELYVSSHKKQLENYSRIVVINEIGTCINCNNIFSKSMAQNVDSDSTLFIVSGVGAKVDLSAYIDSNSPNLIFDESTDFDTLNIVSSCAIINLNQGKIDKIETINVETVHGLAEQKF